MRKVFSHFNPAPMKYEHNSGISLTEPDQSMTLEEIIQAFMDGVQIDADKDSYYDGDDDLDTAHVDLYDDALDAIDHAPMRMDATPEETSEKKLKEISEEKPEETSEEKPDDEYAVNF